MVTIFTLSNGEQIIGEQLEGSHRLKYDIDNPFYMVEAQDEYGAPGLKLINVCTFSEKQSITIDKQHVMFSFTANDPMVRYYNKLVEATKKSESYRVLEDSIREMEEMEEKMRDAVSKRLVGGSTIN
jgi:hypothetical protein